MKHEIDIDVYNAESLNRIADSLEIIAGYYKQLKEDTPCGGVDVNIVFPDDIIENEDLL